MELSMRAYQAISDLTPAQIAYKLQASGVLKGDRKCSRQSVEGWIAAKPQKVFVVYTVNPPKLKKVFRRDVSEIWNCELVDSVEVDDE